MCVHCMCCACIAEVVVPQYMHSVPSEIIAECQVACMLVIIRLKPSMKSCQLHSSMSICFFAVTQLDGD